MSACTNFLYEVPAGNILTWFEYIARMLYEPLLFLPTIGYLNDWIDCNDFFFLSFLACVAITEELNYSISQTDPKKMIHVGGFRLKPDGSLTDKKVWFSQC